MGDQDFPLERSWYIGNAFFAILYGIQISMFFQSVYYLNIGPGSRQSKMFYIGYSALLMVLITIALACNQFFGQAMWIEHRDFAGGPVAFFGANIAAWYNTLGTAADVTANVLGDGLMLYRCYVFWGHVRWAMVFPTLLYLSSVAMGITTTIQSGLPGGDLFEGITVNFGIPWVVLTIVFNILVTGMIVGRLTWMHSRARKVLGTDLTQRYTGLVAILVESALPFTILGICYLALYVRNDIEDLAFAGIWGCFVSLSPQAIILRVAMGGAWTQETVNRVASEIEMPVIRNSDPEPDQKYSTSSHVQV
ncbi:hypothetical protein C8R44DRAFT_792202 [Mycena epipterygia]|nr:hypothetical protein C8R44DRAFT_792202 [Mycena epipterygia]